MVKKKDATTEQKILNAAREVFITVGMDGARMQDIADRAGINKALLHYYFRDKGKLFETIFLEEAEKFFPKINLIFESEGGLEQKIIAFVNAYLDELQQNPYLPWFVLNEIHRDPDKFLKKIWTRNHRPDPTGFLMQLEKEMQLGNIRRIDPRQLLLNLLSLTLFPFIARPLFTRNLGISEIAFEKLLEQRRQQVPQFIMAALRN